MWRTTPLTRATLSLACKETKILNTDFTNPKKTKENTKEKKTEKPTKKEKNRKRKKLFSLLYKAFSTTTTNSHIVC
jgi:hypothetical protein